MIALDVKPGPTVVPKDDFQHYDGQQNKPVHQLKEHGPGSPSDLECGIYPSHITLFTGRLNNCDQDKKTTMR